MCREKVCDSPDDCMPDPGCNAAFPDCPECTVDQHCESQSEDRRCDVLKGDCVECLDNADCSATEPLCVEGDCEECITDDDCAIGRCRNGDCGID
ncbi:MAG: hypothetical protein ABW321_00260 [Polyangiales bacterium]